MTSPLYLHEFKKFWHVCSLSFAYFDSICLPPYVIQFASSSCGGELEIESLIGLQLDWWGKLWIGLVEGTVLMLTLDLWGKTVVGELCLSCRSSPGENCGTELSVCYGDMDQDALKIHVSRFRSRKTMLIVTDVAAHGIDIPLLDNPKIFVHRVGRATRAGRTGTAYSFVTPDDMAYLLDLHLFLSKPIKPAPTKRSSCRIWMVQSPSAELELLQRTCKNAFHLYSKTKPLPAKESIRRVMDLPREGLHRMFMKVLETGELIALAFSEHLKKFRPKQTVLESEGEAAKSKHQRNNIVVVPPLPGIKINAYLWGDVMKRKRAIHENIINLVHEQQQSKDNKEKDLTKEVVGILEAARSSIQCPMLMCVQKSNSKGKAEKGQQDFLYQKQVEEG
ncbi:hypothetical protein V8G54_027795 [Vigna mungo]|uniref:Helicase C-terminal domain-containing protein n=1 Tax=Vigna mungo TaxID=3915 RepID=A0AAQ3MRT9_VIGMU